MRALKPGNVGEHGAGHGMRCEDFVKSADLCAEAICAPNVSLGKRIHHAVAATRRCIPYNTNLGIILLCAPLMQAVHRRGGKQPLRAALAGVLSATTVGDAVEAYAAIRLAAPGGMGRVAEADLAAEPALDLREAMYFARDRDLIARQYVNDYQQIFEHALPALLEFRARWGHNAHAVTGVFLTLLAAYPDSLVIRKFGKDKAEQLRRVAEPLYCEFSGSQKPGELRDTLLAMDKRLKSEGLNPGTTADLTVATVLVAALEHDCEKTAAQAGG